MKLACVLVGGAARVAVIEQGVPARLLPAAAQDVADVIAAPQLLAAAGEPVSGPVTIVAPVRIGRQMTFVN